MCRALYDVWELYHGKKVMGTLYNVWELCIVCGIFIMGRMYWGFCIICGSLVKCVGSLYKPWKRICFELGKIKGFKFPHLGVIIRKPEHRCKIAHDFKDCNVQLSRPEHRSLRVHVSLLLQLKTRARDYT